MGHPYLPLTERLKHKLPLSFPPVMNGKLKSALVNGQHRIPLYRKSFLFSVLAHMSMRFHLLCPIW
jgi:hypothetical protein